MYLEGLIIKSTGSWYQVLKLGTNLVFEARIRGKFKLLKNRLTNPLAVGDRVKFLLEKEKVAWIVDIQPRKNYLIRKSVNLSKESHIIASNIDVACFLFTLRLPETSLGFLDRFLVCCETYGIPPLILFNKTDLLDEKELGWIEGIENSYRNIGYKTIKISCISNKNIESIKGYLTHKVSVFFGHSGVGKSTLIQRIQPQVDIKTGEISHANAKGRHTTSFAQMYFWDFGGSVIDIPGLKEFGIIDIKREEVQNYFPEIFFYAKDCKFGNCLHTNEPKCAVIESRDKGRIPKSRYQSYTNVLEEAG
ncbi:MAG: ribosome small subunit-dependent GTPase A [Bergeyella sp.]|nr:ribosome small subunit-dependent GTPase A [Bergeyella sp.]